MTRRIYLWLGLSLAFVIAAVIIFVAFFYQARLTVIPTPGDAEVILNGQPIATGVPQKLPPGHYDLTLRAKNYLTEKTSVDLSIGENHSLAVSLRLVPEIRRMAGDVRSAVTSDNQTDQIYYLGQNGSQFFRLPTLAGADGAFKPEAISEARFSNVQNVVWSPDRSLAIIQTNDGQTKLFDFKRYDFLSQDERDLGPNLRQVTWHPSQKTIIAFESTPSGERSLIREEITSGKAERLIDLRPYQLTNPTLSWSPDGRTVLLVEEAVYLYDVTTRTIKKVARTDSAKAANWSPGGQQLLVEFTRGLSLITVADQALTDLTYRVALAKTAWLTDGSGLIVATPTDTNQDQFQRVLLADQTTAVYRYLTSQPISTDSILVAEDGHQLWLTSNGTLWNVILEIDA
ncbi:MAG: hypothetical protein AAB647_01085 [Patescibacteria group bacterium]